MSLPILRETLPERKLTPQAQLLVRAAHANVPVDVSIELTHHCNLRCRHCYIPDFHAPDRLTTERVLTLLEELVEMGTLYLTLTGGELFLRRDWRTIATRARDLGFALRLFSNATLIDDETADAIVPLRATVEISLYAMNEETFDDLTQRKGSFAKTLVGIERLRQRQIPVVLKTPMTTENRGELEAIAEYARQVGARFSPAPTIVSKKDGDHATLALRISPEEHREFLQSLETGGPSSGCHVGPMDPRDPRKEGPMCAAASRYCNITSSGDVMACNILPGSGGNLNEKSFREIWEHSPWLQEVRSIRRKDLHTCSDCDRLSYCGRCHAMALVEDGDLYGPSTFAQRQAKMLEELDERRRAEV